MKETATALARAGRGASGERVNWEDRRQAIIEAAAPRFAQCDFGDVTMRQIGTDCSLHMATLYHYFKDKSELYSAVCSWACNQISETLLSALAVEGSAIARLARYMAALTRFMVEDHIAATILDREFVLKRDIDQIQLPQLSNRLVEIVADIVRELSPPILARISPERLGEMIWDIIYGVTRYKSSHDRVVNRIGVAFDADLLVRESGILVDQILSTGEKLSEALRGLAAEQ